MLKWFRKAKPGRYEVHAKNLYDALVSDDGPGSDTLDFITADKLGIRLGDLSKFSEKRLITLEALCFSATLLGTAQASEKLRALFGQEHPLPLEFVKLLRAKWASRGINFGSEHAVGERCLNELELFLEFPFRWGREWLQEFYADPEVAGEHYIMWTDQWLKQFIVMQKVVSDLH